MDSSSFQDLILVFQNPFLYQYEAVRHALAKAPISRSNKDILLLLTVTAKCSILSLLPVEIQRQLCRVMSVCTFYKDGVIAQQRQPAMHVNAILRGSASQYHQHVADAVGVVKGKFSARFYPGETFEATHAIEAATSTENQQHRYRCTVIATETTDVLRISLPHWKAFVPSACVAEIPIARQTNIAKQAAHNKWQKIKTSVYLKALSRCQFFTQQLERKIAAHPGVAITQVSKWLQSSLIGTVLIFIRTVPYILMTYYFHIYSIYESTQQVKLCSLVV